MRTGKWLLLAALMLVSARVDAAPTQVYVGVYVYSVSELNLAEGTYLLDGYLWFRWQGTALPADKFEFSVINGTVESADDSPVVHQGDTYRASRRVKLRLRSNFVLDDYPFDKQVLPLQLEHRWDGIEQLVFVPDDGAVPEGKSLRQAFLSSGLKIGDWIIDSARHRVVTKQYETDFGSIQKGVWDGKSSRYVFEVQLRRRLLPYTLKVLLPLLVIVAMGILVFFMDAREFGTQCGVAITALLSCVAFHISQPQVGYLVKADFFFFLSYAAIFCSLCAVVASNKWVHAGDPARSNVFVRKLRLPVLIAFGGGVVAVVLSGMT
jgi:branched-chain amino acid transport system substrate-binding protein